MDAAEEFCFKEAELFFKRQKIYAGGRCTLNLFSSVCKVAAEQIQILVSVES